nr:Protein of unknown function DUF148 domain containing protein [Haemonchus contortus]
MNIAIVILSSAVVVLGQQTGKNSPCNLGGRRPASPPSFLRNLTKEARNEYLTIVAKQNETIAAKKQEVLTWAQKYGIETKVQEYDSIMMDTQRQLKENVTNFTDDWNTVVEQYYSAMENEEQTPEEQRRSLRNLSDQFPVAYDVLQFALIRFKPDQFGSTQGDSVSVEWGPRIPNNDIIRIRPSSPPPSGVISPGGPPPLPDGGDPFAPLPPSDVTSPDGTPSQPNGDDLFPPLSPSGAISPGGPPPLPDGGDLFEHLLPSAVNNPDGSPLQPNEDYPFLPPPPSQVIRPGGPPPMPDGGDPRSPLSPRKPRIKGSSKQCKHLLNF